MEVDRTMKKEVRVLALVLLFLILVGCTDVERNSPPRIESFTPPDEQVVSVPDEVIEFSVTAADSDQDKLEYLWESWGVGELKESKSAKTTWRAPSYEGTATIRVTVSDGQGGTVSHTWQIRVGKEKGSEGNVLFKDSSLEGVIRRAIGKQSGDIVPRDVLDIVYLDADDENIVSLAGIEYLTGLEVLHLNNNSISDVAPLANLRELKELSLIGNPIQSIEALAGLTRLEHLNLWATEVSDISPLAGLTNLVFLNIGASRVKDISAVAGLVNLEQLILRYNHISDIDALARLTKLEELALRHNRVSDINVLVRLNSLEQVDLDHNKLDLSLGSAAMNTIQELLDRGVEVDYDPQYPASVAELPVEWKHLLLVYSEVDAVVEREDGTAFRFRTTMPEENKRVAVEGFENLANLIREGSNGMVTATTEVVYLDHPLTDISYAADEYGKYIYRADPDSETVKADLAAYAPRGSFDSVHVLWNNGEDGVSKDYLPAYFGLGGYLLYDGTTTFDTVVCYEPWVWLDVGEAHGEVWLHEWLHGVESFMTTWGYSQEDFPVEGLHGSEHYGYRHSPPRGWMGWYSDFMQGKVWDAEQGRYLGITEEMWRIGRPTDQEPASHTN